MKILIAGATGFIGTELCKLLSQNHQVTVVVLGRSRKRLKEHFPKPNMLIETWDNLSKLNAKSFDLIINLSGSNISQKRWTPLVKKELIESRTLTNKKLIDWLISQEASPRFFCASAVGIYGSNVLSKIMDEDYPIQSAQEDDFLKEIGISWENSLAPARDKGIATTSLRFGVVLKKGQGMLKKMELPFRLGLGSILGNGQQVISWVHYEDLVNAILFLIEHPLITGPINITAPKASTQREFAHALAHTLRRPLFLRLPSFFITAIFGEMGDNLLLKGQSVVPKRLTELGFTFKYPKLEAALRQEYQE